ncbi:type III-B CRISPR module RAMP protein Cmr4 [Alteromonas gilva]|uniref:Type III-B CRISPR module RAMP protein Cmr4 n=1 Tax=Alteromonas gilva TaxID=2987522 RepID=A0ABT5L6S0_9ALTE|nr:type III-B CRISPR module RAMP protein Cmr4 [Alteromonas gilva]MDC8832071.1 type III-B CRISPR module RAMP protein Cmr4 [Alteromonas gilva]
MNQFITLFAETYIHAGAGIGAGFVDLPIMREAHTDWPCIFGSAIKGAWRAHAVNKLKMSDGGELNDDLINDLFGREDATAAGNMLVSDARLLWLPVRSLTTHTLWITCPAILRRFKRDLCRASDSELNFTEPSVFEPDSVIVSEELANRADQNMLYIEEHGFKCKNDQLSLFKSLTEMPELKQFKDEIERKLVILSDDVFAHFCRTATPVTPHIKVGKYDPDAQKRHDNNLWYEETLPPETMMYLTLSLMNKENDTELNTLLESSSYLQVGGNATVGMGWFNVSTAEDESAGRGAHHDN